MHSLSLDRRTVQSPTCSNKSDSRTLHATGQIIALFMYLIYELVSLQRVVRDPTHSLFMYLMNGLFNLLRIVTVPTHVLFMYLIYELVSLQRTVTCTLHPLGIWETGIAALPMFLTYGKQIHRSSILHFPYKLLTGTTALMPRKKVVLV